MYQLFILGGHLLGGSPNLLALPVPDPSVSIAAETDGTITIDAGTGDITITITSPAEYAGTFQASTADLAAGPVNLVPPAVAGVGNVGATLTGTPGLWIYDGSVTEPTVATVWTRGGVAIAGATATSYTVIAADQGSDLRMEETATDSNGSRTAASAPVSVSGAAPGFQPGDIAGLAAWWDASDAATVTLSGTDVQQWDDKSTNGYDITPVQGEPAVAATTAFPEYLAAGQNGQGTILTDWANLEALKVPSIPAIGGSAVRSIFVVAKNVGSLAGYFTLAEATSTNYKRWTLRNDAGFLRLEIQGAGVTSALALSTAGNIVAGINAGTTLGDHTIYVDGVGEALTGTSVQNTSTSHSYIGRQLETSGAGNAIEVAEVVVYAAALSQADREKVEGYLAHKWGLTANLGAGHPYKSTAP